MGTQHIPKNAFALAAYMQQIVTGDDKHKSEKALCPEVRARLIFRRKRLLASRTRVQLAEGELAQARLALRKDKDHATSATQRARDNVYALWTDRDPVILDYGLKMDTRGRPKGSKNQ